MAPNVWTGSGPRWKRIGCMASCHGFSPLKLPARFVGAVTWLPATGPGDSCFARVFALRPNLYEDYCTFAAKFWAERPVSPVLLELCRLRVAALLGCERELRLRRPDAIAEGLDGDKIAA